jgi:hypothetical protein
MCHIIAVTEAEALRAECSPVLSHRNDCDRKAGVSKNRVTWERKKFGS